MSTLLPQPSIRRSARERQQAVLGDCARRFPGLAPIFTVQPKANYSVTRNRAGLDCLPPRFATLQHHLPFAPAHQSPLSSSDDNGNHNSQQQQQQQVQYVVHPAPVAFLAANNNSGGSSSSDASSTAPAAIAAVATVDAAATTTTITPAPRILLTIQPHAALTPQEIATHTLLRQIGLLPRGSPEEVQARRARIEENKRSAEARRQRRGAKQKKKMEEAEKASKKDGDAFLGWNNVKSGRVEKPKVAKTTEVAVMQKTAAAAAAIREEDDNDGDVIFGGKCNGFC